MVSKQMKTESIKVFIRFKPLMSEKLNPLEYTVNDNENGSHTLFLKNTNVLSRNSENLAYKFDDIFPSNTSQLTIFEKIGSPMIDKFVQKGVSGTIFSYGQTGSGKTYTICGLKQVKHRGIIHQAFGRIFDHVQVSSSGEKYKLQLSFIEIYNNKIRDLAKSNTASNNVIHFSKNIKRISVTNELDAIKLFEKIKLKRKTSATSKNEHSSRSHFICTIHLTKYDHMLKIYGSEFNLVDLAGSETYDGTGNKITKFESRAVNQSLYHLRQVTRKLVDPNFKGNIPYRTSRLTWVLENTLGKQCRVAMIANVDSDNNCLKESVNTFEFATDIASIKKFIVDPPEHAPTFRMKDENLLTKYELFKKQYGEMKIDTDKMFEDCDQSLEYRVLFLGMKLLAELSMKSDSLDDNTINSYEAADTASAIKNEIHLGSGDSSVPRNYPQVDVPVADSKTASACSWNRTILGKLKTLGNYKVQFVEIGNTAAVAAVAAVVGLGSVVTGVMGFGSVVAAVVGLGSTIAAATGFGNTVAQDVEFGSAAAAVVGLGSVAAVAAVVGFGSAVAAIRRSSHV